MYGHGSIFVFRTFYSNSAILPEFILQTPVHIVDADFPKKLAVWLQDKTGRAWTLERCEQSPHKQTVTEQKKEELVSDPLIANAMSLFENAEIVGVSK